MSLFGVFYEFAVNERNVKYLVQDVGITQGRGASAVLDVAQNLLDLINEREYICKSEVFDKPGLMLRFSRNLTSERLPHTIEGAHAFIHPSSEGYLELEDFKTRFEESLSRGKIPYTKYD